MTGAALSSCLGGCTMQRIADDPITLKWLRLSDATPGQGSTRWQLPRNAHVRVVEAGPAEDPTWLAAAQAGVNRVFPAPPGAYQDFELLVTWPMAEPVRDDFALQVALVRASDGAVVDTALLEVEGQWFASRATEVSRAFEFFASDFRGNY